MIGVDHRLVHPGRRVGRSEGIAARVEHVILVARSRQDPGVGGKDVADRAAGAKRRFTGGERLTAGVEHVPMAWIDTADGDHVHETGVIVAVGGRELERHLVAAADAPVTGVVADQQGLAAASHRPPAGRGVAVAGQDRLHHLPVDRARRRARHREPVGHRQRRVRELTGAPHVLELGRALDEAQQPDEVARILGAAEAVEGGVDHLASLRGQPVGVVLHAEPLAAAPVVVQHVPQIVARGRPLPVAPDPYVLDHGCDARLPEVGRARAQGQRAVRPQIHALEHAVAAGVVAGQVVHALLPEEQEPVKAARDHCPAGAAPPVCQFPGAEV